MSTMSQFLLLALVFFVSTMASDEHYGHHGGYGDGGYGYGGLGHHGGYVVAMEVMAMETTVRRHGYGVTTEAMVTTEETLDMVDMDTVVTDMVFPMPDTSELF
uniref:Uncharacterized protein n=1 Tax=Ditylenchus dipsaci TaxID=166011 RepID=A0A915E5A9_9BILA